MHALTAAAQSDPVIVPPAPGAQALPSAPQTPPAAAAGSGASEGEKSAENNPMADEMTPELILAVDRGLEYLRAQMNPDGSFGRGRYSRHVGIVSLCGIAMLADGNTPGRGRYGAEVEAVLEFVLAHASDAGFFAAETSHGPMYGHGFATLFLGEIYGMTPEDRRVHEALTRAVDIIIGSQNEEGGWRYNPVPHDADVSVTICQVMALRSARNAGIKVPKETIDRAVQYIRDCQNDDGGFRYMKIPGASAWPRTAAGVATLFYAGIYEDDSIDRGLAYLLRRAMPGGPSSNSPHYYYGHYYAAQAMPPARSIACAA